MSTGESPPEDLGNGAIDAEDAQLAMPPTVEQWDVLSRDGNAFWAWDQSVDRLAVTQSRRSLDESATFTRIDSTDISPEGVVSLPEAFFEEGDDRPWTGYFRSEDRCYFAARGDLLNDDMCYAMTERDNEDFWNDYESA